VEGDFIIAKWENNAFTSKAFEKRVQSSNRLILTGCNLEFCVRETADHAAEMGFEVIIPRDAVLSRDTLSFRKLHTHLRFLLNGIKLVRHKEM
jgi:nicotinamidase-related amidase